MHFGNGFVLGPERNLSLRSSWKTGSIGGGKQVMATLSTNHTAIPSDGLLHPSQPQGWNAARNATKTSVGMQAHGGMQSHGGMQTEEGFVGRENSRMNGRTHRSHVVDEAAAATWQYPCECCFDLRNSTIGNERSLVLATGWRIDGDSPLETEI